MTQWNAPLRIWLCDCGRIHIESPYCRRTYSPAEFVNLLRFAALGKQEWEPTSPPSNEVTP